MESREQYVTAIACNAHAIDHALKRHGPDAAEIIAACKRGEPCTIYESWCHNRRMLVFELWGALVGLLFSTKGGAFVTAFYVNESRLGHLIARDGYVRVREAA